MKDTIDLLKINNGLYGVINFNNMIAVTKKNYTYFDLTKKSTDKKEEHRLNLLNNQLRWLNKNKKQVFRKSKLLYDLYRNNNLATNVKKRCCNFILLEKMCNEYNKK